MKKLFALILFIAPFIAQSQVTGLELPYGVKVLDTLATDAWYGPYQSIEHALESIPEAVRKHRTVKIDTLEYWWRDGNADEDLILKSSAPAQTTIPWDSVTSRPTTLSGYGITDAWPLNGTGNVTGNVDIDYGSSLRTTRIGSMSWHNRYVQIGTGGLWVKGFQQHNWGDRSIGLGGSEVGWYYHAGDLLQENTTVPKFEATAKEINFSIKKWTNNNIGQGFRLLGSAEESTWFRFDPQAGYFDITLYPENEWLDNDYAAFLKYSADYSDYYIDSARWIPDVGAVKKIMNEGSFWNRNGTTTINTDEPYATVIDGQGNGPLEFVDLWGFKVRSLGGYQFEEVPQSTDSVGRILTINEDGIMGWVPKDSLGGGGGVTIEQVMDSIYNAIDTLSSGGSTNATAIRGVTVDASAASPSDGDILVYRSAGSDWVLESKPTGGGIEIAQVMDSITNAIDTLASLSGATFTGPVTFTPSSTTEGINIGSTSTNPSAPNNGGLWYNSASNYIGARVGGANRQLITSSSSDITTAFRLVLVAGQGRITQTASDANYTSNTLNLPNINVSTGATLPAATSIGDVSATEIGYVDGVTSAIQTQLNARAIITPTTSTGTVVAFDTNRSYCTSASPCTGNITFNSSGAVVGQIATMVHNDSSTPTFGSEFILLSGTYVENEDNYIMFFLRESGKVWVTISQEQ